MEATMEMLEKLGLDEDLTRAIMYVVNAWNLSMFCDLTEDEIDTLEDYIHNIEMLFAKVQMRRDYPEGWR